MLCSPTSVRDARCSRTPDRCRPSVRVIGPENLLGTRRRARKPDGGSGGLHPVLESKVTLGSLVLSLVLFPPAAAILGYPRIVTGGAACRVLGSTRRA